MRRKYYSIRTGKNPKSAEIDLATLKALFLAMYRQLEEDGYFQEHFGYYCVDEGEVPGNLGSDVGTSLLFNLRKDNLWPLHERLDTYTEDDLFDIIEFLHDHCSKPIDGYYHSFSSCGHHYSSFNAVAGQRAFREKVNPLLESYQDGFELSSEGEILELAQPGVGPLLQADVPVHDANIKKRIDSAISKFRRYRSSLDERRHAIRDLADVLEYLRPQIKEVLTKPDESDLFNIANNFSIRHHNTNQKADYDQAIWLSWMFYFYLSTIHACLRMLAKKADS